MTWWYYAFGCAFFTGITAVLAKIGLKKSDSDLAAAMRTTVVFIFSCFMVKTAGVYQAIGTIGRRNLIFLILCGIASGVSCLLYFRSFQCGNINKAVPVTYLSTVLTMLIGMLFLHEALSKYKIVAMVLMTVGIYMMASRAAGSRKTGGHKWLVYAIFGAVFASLSAILEKIGITGVDSRLIITVQMVVGLAVTWIFVLIKGKQKHFKTLPFRNGMYICLSGLAIGLAWICYRNALALGKAEPVILIERMSIVVTMICSCVFLKEQLSKKAMVGLIFLAAGIIFLLL